MYSRPKETMQRIRAKAVALSARNDFVLVAALVLATLLILLATAIPAKSQEERPTMKLSMRQAMELALQKNYDIQIRALDSETSFANLVGAYSVYDITLYSNANFNRATSRATSIFGGEQQQNESFLFRASRKLFTGADMQSSLRLSRRSSNSIINVLNPEFTDRLTFEFSQPILKNFGKLSTERQIRINRNNNIISDVDFENQIITTLVDLESRYWDLVGAYDALRAAEESLVLAQRQLEINKVKVEVGTIPEIEIVAAEQQVADRESGLVDAQALLSRAEDRLKQAIVMDDWDVRIEPTEKMREEKQQQIDFGQSFEKALEERPEIRKLDLQIENNEISMAFAKNQLFPSVNLTASFELSSKGGTFYEDNLFEKEPEEGTPLGFYATFYDVFSGTNRDWTVGANVTYILGNSQAKSQFMLNKVQKRQNELRMDQTRYSIAVEVRSAIRELQNSCMQVEARRKALLYSERQLEAEQQKFDVGTSTNFQVLDYQNRLTQARYNLITARIRYQKALVDYDRATGVLLDENKIAIETTAEGVAGARMK